MTISEKTIKLLWSNAAGRCSFSECQKRLTVEQAAEISPYTLGEMAHIKGRQKSSNRYDVNQPDDERDNYENLILLCPDHHTLIDKLENEQIYTVDKLTSMKIAHENSVLNRLEVEDLSSIEKLKDRIAIYLAENRQAWIQYGPLSDAARKNPNNDEIYAVWTSERLSTIVPNNRKIASLLETYRSLFKRRDQVIISEFLSHVMSYEKWIKDEIPYQAVKRFPVEFESLITED